MTWIKIQIPDKNESAEAFYEMSRRGRITCLPDDVYVVPEPALDLLQSIGVTFHELGRGGVGYAETAIRDSAANPVQ